MKRAAFALGTLALFFVLVEIVLALGGVAPLARERDPLAGFSERVRVYELVADRGVYRTRPHAVVHSFHPQEFAARKPPQGYRVFVLGGSSAFGFPWGAAAAFPKALGAALQAQLPGRTVETVNAAAMSYGSHRELVLARELLGYEPDALVLYTGHNEFIERRFYRDILGRRPELDSVRALLDRWRLYSLLVRLRPAASANRPGSMPAGAPTTGELLGLDVVREDSTDVGAAEVEQVRRTFEANLRSIVAAARGRGVHVVLCTVPSNERHWKPNQSLFGPEVPAPARRQVGELLETARRALGAGAVQDAEAVQQEHAAAALPLLEQAAALAPSYAETHFLLGRAYEGAGRWAEAARAYRDARDHDAQPSRAPSALNETIRTVAREEGALLVDVEQAFVAASPHGLLGFNWFEDYVHPKPAAHLRIAREIWQALVESGWLGAPREAEVAAFEHAVAALARPESGAADAPAAADGAASPRQLFNLGFVLENQGLVAQAIEKYRAALELQPAHHAARYNLARLLAREGRLVEAEADYRIALATAREDPLLPHVLVGLGDAVRGLGRLDEALALYREAASADSGWATAWQRLGDALAESGRAGEAEQALRRALELDPQDLEARVRLGLLELVDGRIEAALADFEAVVAARPDHLVGRDGLGAALVESGRLDEGERIFREVLEDDPQDAMARGGLEIIARRRAAAR